MADVTINQLFHKVLSKFLVTPGFARHIVVHKKKKHGPPGQRRRTCRRVLQA